MIIPIGGGYSHGSNIVNKPPIPQLPVNGDEGKLEYIQTLIFVGIPFTLEAFRTLMNKYFYSNAIYYTKRVHS